MIRKALEADRAQILALCQDPHCYEGSAHILHIHQVELFTTTNLKDTS